MAIDNNTYYQSKNITIFPSSNAVDNGKLFTETNGRNITKNITNTNYAVSPKPGAFSLTYVNNLVSIAKGKAIINGFEVDAKSDVTFRLPTNTDTIVSDVSNRYNNYYLLCLKTNFDSLDNISGNIQVDGIWYCEGITICYVSLEEYTNNKQNYLLLGGVKQNGDMLENNTIYQKFDAKDIFVHVDTGKNSVPPTQDTDLDSFVNNILKAYYVSKYGDNEYKELVFTDNEPLNYTKEGFDYNNETSVDDNIRDGRYGVRINSDFISVKNKDNNNDGFIKLLNKAIEFYPIFTATATNSVKNIAYDKTNDEIIIKNNNIAFHIATNDVYVTSSSNIKSHLYSKNNDILLESQDSSIRISLVDNKITFTVPDFLTSDDNSIAGIQFVDSKGKTVGLNVANKTETINGWWNNVLQLYDCVHIKAKEDNLLGCLHVDGYVVAGKTNSTANITVPDVAHGGPRALSDGDIYATKAVWSSVYNDIAEVFEVSDNIEDLTQIDKLVLSLDENNVCQVADRKTYSNVIGIASAKPAFCCGGKDIKHGIPVALAGRVYVKYDNKHKIKLGDYVGLSKHKKGYVTKCKKHSKYLCGKVLEIVSSDEIRILVK